MKYSDDLYDVNHDIKLASVFGIPTSESHALIAGLKANGIPKNKQSACKRLCLMLRWLIRDDNKVDLGIWKSLSKTKLYIPLDVHVNRVSRNLGLLKRNASDFKAVQELTENCKKYYPE
mgnify:CR=1 FL=1